jgi:ribosome assembly protein YihI (activator of Der GTPase)
MYRKAQDKMETEIQLKAEQVTKFNSQSRKKKKKTKSAIAGAENKNFRNSQNRYITYRRTRQGPKKFSRSKLTLITTHDKCHPTFMSVLSNRFRSVSITITSPSQKYYNASSQSRGGSIFPLK